MNTVGKPGKLGEHVRCVVSVSMLTEGWDANTVTHILGIRAFGTQLLCEQVVGRGLRRMSYAANDERALRPGVRRGLRRAVLVHTLLGHDQAPEPGPDRHPRPGDPRADRLRNHVAPPARLSLRDRRRAAQRRSSTPIRNLALSTADIPTKTENAPIVGEISIHTLDDLKGRRDTGSRASGWPS